MTDFQTAAIALGGLLICGALVSGLAQRSFLSLAAVYAITGFVLGHGGVEVLNFDPQSGFVRDLAFTALIVILFRDGLEVESEMLQSEWHLPLRKLALAMPLTAGIVAVAAHVIVGLTWTEGLLLGSVLAPTDPVLTSSIVTNPRVPRIVRHSLNLESGMNDGLALPAVLAFLAALSTSADHFVWWRFVVEDIGLGLVYGLACGWVASLLLVPDRSRLEHSIPSHQMSLYGLGVAFGTYGLTVLPPHGNGFIAVFVAAIVLGIRRPDLRRHFEQRADEVVEIVKLGVFVVFGSLLGVNALLHDGMAAAGMVLITFLVARPLAVWVSLTGTSTDTPTRLFMGWFGPKGVATIAFSLIVLDEHIPAGPRIFDLAALIVLCSIIVHGISDTPGARWISRHAQRTAEEPPVAAEHAG